MRKKKLTGMMLAVVMVSSLLTGCGSSTTDATEKNPETAAESSVAASASTEDGNTAGGVHEPLTISAPGRSVKDFIDVVHEKYPEIVFDVDAYAGANGTGYMLDQLKTDNLPDIYSISYYVADQYDVSDKLIDLAGYSFTDNYVSSRLREVNEGGSIYLLPSYYSCVGITYNKKILADNGWTLPKSLEELEELAPKVEAAG